MGNQQSNTHSGNIPLPQRSGSSIAADGYTHVDGRGNSDNTDHYYRYGNQGGTNTSPTDAEILHCLCASEYEEHRNRVREPVEGTCSWVTGHSTYRDWLENRTSGPLWLSGGPGCGKSVLASFLVTHLEGRTNDVVCYFFFKDDNDEQRSARSALCALLHQIFKRRTDLIELAKEEFRAKGKSFTEEVNTLWNILVKAATEGGQGGVICVVDALDECEERALDQLIRCVPDLPGSRAPDIPLKFLFTSRPCHKIERELGSLAATIRLNEEGAITTDITRVVDEGIRDLESYWDQPSGLGYLRNLLTPSVNRTFLWVSLVLEFLKCSEDGSQEEFTNIVSTAPHDLAQLYTKILDKSRYPYKARQILHMVVAAARPLTLREMIAALRIKRKHRSVRDLGDLPAQFSKSVESWCGPFVRVINSKIYLAHQTAREFLIKGSLTGRGNWQYTLCSKDSNYLLADICISCLSLEDFQSDPPPNRRSTGYDDYEWKYSLLKYAAVHWAGHFRDSQTRQMELFESTRLICAGGSTRFETWLKVYWEHSGQYHPFPDDFTHLMIATWLRQGAVVERLLREGGGIHVQSRRYGSALNIAAARNEENITRMLLRRSAKAHLRGLEYNILQTKRSRLDWLERLEYSPSELMFSDMPRELELDAIRFLKSFCIQDTLDPQSLPGQSTTPVS